MIDYSIESLISPKAFHKRLLTAVSKEQVNERTEKRTAKDHTNYDMHI
jgi:hypothetical protein